MTWIDPTLAAQRQHTELARMTGLAHGRMLELECGDGLYLKYFQDHGWECLGTTTREEDYQAAFSNEVLCLNGPLDELNMPQKSYDMVRLRGTLHMEENTAYMLERAFLATHPTGYIVIETWNHSGWPFRGVQQDSTGFFTQESLRTLLTEAGFEGGGIFAPALGDPTWAPLHPTASLSFFRRFADSIQSFFDRGSLLVAIAQRPPD